MNLTCAIPLVAGYKSRAASGSNLFGIQRLLQLTCVLVGLLAMSAHAGSAFFNFNSNPATNGLLTLFGNAVWVPTDGAGAATNSSDGYLQITASATNQRSAVVFADFDNGFAVKAFNFDADLRIGNGSIFPADGFSINYVRANDPVLAATNPSTANVWATGPNCAANLPEEGTQTGISIGFDAYDSGGTAPFCNEASQSIGPDIIGISVRVDGILLLQYPVPTLNGTCGDPSSLQTGPLDGTGNPAILCWQHLKVVLDTNSLLSVYWKNTVLLSNYPTSYIPSPGRLVLGGRTGASWENHHLDNMAITTIPANLAVVGAASGFPDGFSVVINDSGSSVVNTGQPITAVLNGSSATPLSIIKTGAVTVVTYHGFPRLLTPGATNTVTITCRDINNVIINGTRTFVTPAYSTVPAALAASGVNTNALGFRLLPWQSGTEPNRIYWANEQIAGLHGTNKANLTSATDGGYIDYGGVINFNIRPSGFGGADAGDFRTNNGYADTLFQGIPGTNGLTGSTAMEILGFVQFQSPGLFQMGVNSDDGFAVTVGLNPKDRFAQLLGQFDGGRGPADSVFYVAITNAGIYPFRLLWENGAGELPNNGAALEWFTVQPNGTRILINDPSPTNTSGVKVFFSGPPPPAYVSHINPYNGATQVRPDTLVVQLTDGSTFVVPGTITLSLNGSPVTTAVTKIGNLTTVTAADATHVMAPGNQTAQLLWTDNLARTWTNTWSFTVEPYPTLDTSLLIPLAWADPTKPGLTLRAAQVDPCLPIVLNPAGPNDCGDTTENQIDSANAMLAGLYFPWYGTNAADVSTAVTNNIWYWNNAMDFNIGGSAGDFAYDYALPGIPTADGVATQPFNSFAASWDSYIAFTNAGFYQMGVNSDDGFRLTEALGVSRQVLHVTGTNVNTDVAAVVTSTNNTGSPWSNGVPQTPISGPVVYVDSSQCPGRVAINLAGKIALIDASRCAPDGYDTTAYSYNQLVYMCQTNGAMACIVLASPSWGAPEKMTGGPFTITIPALHVSGFNGQNDFWHTNGPLTATIGADTSLKLGEADFGKGMSHVDFGIYVPQPGLYPMHLVYEQAGGGAGLEWTTLGPAVTFDSTNRALINDAATPGSLMTYRDFIQPQILMQPQNQYGCPGSSVTFYVQVFSSQPVGFSWYSNGVPITAGVVSSSTNSSLALPNIQLSDNGSSIYVVATNQCCYAVSTNAYVNVSSPALITQDPVDASNAPASTITFTVQASPPPLTYNWWFQGTLLTNSSHIQGANSPTLVISNAQPSDAGYYYATVSNSCVLLDSLPACCHIGTCPLVITNQPLNYIAPFQSTVQFVVGVQGAPPVFYQWFQNDVPIPGATLPVLTLPNVQRPQVGVYHVVVSNLCAVVCSDRVHLQIELSYESTLLARQEATDFWFALTNALRFTAPSTAVYRGAPLLFTSYGATAENWETNRCDPAPSHTMWVSYYSTQDQTNRVSTEGSSFPTILSVYKDNPTNNPNMLTCDINSGYDGRSSLLYFHANARTPYYFAIDGVGGAKGTVRLQVGNDVIRNLHFDPPNGPFRFEMAPPYWYSVALHSSTNLFLPQTQWPTLTNIPLTNVDYVVRYTNSSPGTNAQRFYNTAVTTNSPTH